jgi:hypothetical protein
MEQGKGSLGFMPEGRSYDGAVGWGSDEGTVVLRASAVWGCRFPVFTSLNTSGGHAGRPSKGREPSSCKMGEVEKRGVISCLRHERGDRLANQRDRFSLPRDARGVVCFGDDCPDALADASSSEPRAVALCLALPLYYSAHGRYRAGNDPRRNAPRDFAAIVSRIGVLYAKGGRRMG